MGNVAPILALQVIMAGVQGGVMAIPQATEMHTERRGCAGAGKEYGGKLLWPLLGPLGCKQASG